MIYRFLGLFFLILLPLSEASRQRNQGISVKQKLQLYNDRACALAREIPGDVPAIEQVVRKNLNFLNVLLKTELYDMTFLMMASYYGNLEAVQVLLEKKACVDKKDDVTKSTALYLAIYKNKDADFEKKEEIARLLLKSGADPCALNYSQLTPIHEAITQGMHQFLEEALTPENINFLLKLEQESTPYLVARAALAGNFALVIRLINYGFTVDYEHLLIVAVDMNFKELIEYILKSAFAENPSIRISPDVIEKCCRHAWYEENHEVMLFFKNYVFHDNQCEHLSFGKGECPYCAKPIK